MRCQTLQPWSPGCQSEQCKGRPFARYNCSVCKFYDDEPDKK